MNIAMLPTTDSVTDPRLTAFLSPNSREVFNAIATPAGIERADPYDVESIHSAAREAFRHLLARASRTPAPQRGAVLVLLGESGSGKTHLMRAFRTIAHSENLGFCAYAQMTSETNNYARYLLTHVIQGLELPYWSETSKRTGLTRLSTALLESVPGISRDDIETFREGVGDVSELVDDYADRLHELKRFCNCDLELLRVLLYLERRDAKIRNRALMWLRCEDMKPRDRQFIGDAVPRTDESDPMRMLQQFARLIDAVEHMPLVLLIDQLEDMANQSTPIERFVKVIDTVTSLTDAVPSTLVVLAGLSDYFKTQMDKLTKSKVDRITQDPKPIDLLGNRTREEIRAMTARRLAYLYKSAGVEIDPANEIYPFREDHLDRLVGMRSRDVLGFLRAHHQACINSERWFDPNIIAPPPPPPPTVDYSRMWNDFLSEHRVILSDDEEELARILAEAIRQVSEEMPEGYHFGCTVDRQFIEVETHHPNNRVDKLLVALCNKNAQGGRLAKQLTEVEKRVGDFPLALVRTTDFPSTKKSRIVDQIAQLLKRDGRRIVVPNADWRHMLAFAEFRQRHRTDPKFVSWQKLDHPLSELHSLRDILRLDRLLNVSPLIDQLDPPPPKPPISPPNPIISPPPPLPPVLPPAPSGKIVLGQTISSISPTAITLETHEFVQHAAFLGGSGSGKTTAALNLIEQLLARNVPAVLLDRKGDLCRYAAPDAWTTPLPDAARNSEREQLRKKLDVALFTPGEPSGRPLALPLVPSGFAALPEAERERFAQYTASAIGSMIGFKSSDADKGQHAILAKAIETLASSLEKPIQLSILRDLIDNQDNALLNAIGGGFPERYFKNLASRLLTLELNSRQLLQGNEQLDIDALLGTGPYYCPDRVRLSIISTRFLDAAKAEFWVSQFLIALSRWCAKSPQPRLQAVFLFDEADIYLPAGSRQPATKAPMEDLLKRARSAGVSIFLATQSPGDFDYKCKENVRTWLIGRVKEPRAIEKLKPMLVSAKGNVLDKLGGQATGEFFLVRESEVVPVRSEASLLKTEQLPEDQIAKLAAQTLRGR